MSNNPEFDALRDDFKRLSDKFDRLSDSLTKFMMDQGNLVTKHDQQIKENEKKVATLFELYNTITNDRQADRMELQQKRTDQAQVCTKHQGDIGQAFDRIRAIEATVDANEAADRNVEDYIHNQKFLNKIILGAMVAIGGPIAVHYLIKLLG
jgi:chromosome segregation ATPase